MVHKLLAIIFLFLELRAKLVDLALASGKIYEGDGFKYIKESFETGTLHLIGLLSDGGVHSRLDQLQVGLLVDGLVCHFTLLFQVSPFFFFFI